MLPFPNSKEREKESNGSTANELSNSKSFLWDKSRIHTTVNWSRSTNAPPKKITNTLKHIPLSCSGNSQFNFNVPQENAILSFLKMDTDNANKAESVLPKQSNARRKPKQNSQYIKTELEFPLNLTQNPPRIEPINQHPTFSIDDVESLHFFLSPSRKFPSLFSSNTKAKNDIKNHSNILIVYDFPKTIKKPTSSNQIVDAHEADSLIQSQEKVERNTKNIEKIPIEEKKVNLCAESELHPKSSFSEDNSRDEIPFNLQKEKETNVSSDSILTSELHTDQSFANDVKTDEHEHDAIFTNSLIQSDFQSPINENTLNTRVSNNTDIKSENHIDSSKSSSNSFIENENSSSTSPSRNQSVSGSKKLYPVDYISQPIKESIKEKENKSELQFKPVRKQTKPLTPDYKQIIGSILTKASSTETNETQTTKINSLSSPNLSELSKEPTTIQSSAKNNNSFGKFLGNRINETQNPVMTSSTSNNNLHRPFNPNIITTEKAFNWLQQIMTTRNTDDQEESAKHGNSSHYIPPFFRERQSVKDNIHDDTSNYSEFEKAFFKNKKKTPTKASGKRGFTSKKSQFRNNDDVREETPKMRKSTSQKDIQKKKVSEKFDETDNSVGSIISEMLSKKKTNKSTIQPLDIEIEQNGKTFKDNNLVSDNQGETIDDLQHMIHESNKDLEIKPYDPKIEIKPKKKVKNALRNRNIESYF